MAFPTTGIIDSGVRANEGPPPSASYSTPATVNGISIASNLFAGSGANNVAVYTASTFAADCEFYITVTTLVGVGGYAGVMARTVQNTNFTQLDGYGVFYAQVSGTDSILIQRVDNGVGTTLGAVISQELAAGDALGIRCKDTTIFGYYKPAAGAWTLMGVRTDGTYTAAGNPAFLLSGTTGRLSNFGGGIYSAQPIQMRAQDVLGMRRTRPARIGFAPRPLPAQLKYMPQRGKFWQVPTLPQYR